MTKIYKVLASEIEIVTPTYSIKKDRLQDTTNNFEFDYHVLIRKKAVFIIPFYKNNIYLIKQYRYPVDTTMLEVPAGSLANKNEKSIDCARRELHEETGFLAQNITPIGSFFMSPGFSSQKADVFLATELTNDKTSLDQTEIIKGTVKIPLKKIHNYIKNGKISSSHSIASIYMLLGYFNNEKLI